MAAVKTPISLLDGVDTFWWPHSASGDFSVKSAYYSLHQSAIPLQVKPSSSMVLPEAIWKVIWSSNVPQKIKLFLWKVVQNALPTRENLFKRKVNLSPICPICCEDVETLEHLFLLCPWVTPVWFGICSPVVPSRQYVSSCSSWLVDLLCPDAGCYKLNNDQVCWLFTALWSVWKARNAFVFQGVNPNPMRTVHMINCNISDLLHLENTVLPGSTASTSLKFATKWRPPMLDCLKINCDASYLDHKSNVFGGYLIRDCKGKFLSGNTYTGFATSPLVAEALVLRDAVQFAHNVSISNVLLESDNPSIVEACRGNKKLRCINNIVEDIQKLKLRFDRFGITWTARQGNQSAHQIALLHRLHQLPLNWIFHPPPTLRSAIAMDRAGACA